MVRLTLRLEDELYVALAAQAKYEDRSVNAEIVTMIKEGIDRRQNSQPNPPQHPKRPPRHC